MSYKCFQNWSTEGGDLQRWMSRRIILFQEKIYFRKISKFYILLNIRMVLVLLLLNLIERSYKMPNYDLNRLGDEEFELLIQALIKKIIGAGTITFGNGPDGGREATYLGKAQYPSPKEQWEGSWIFQAKFHNTNRIGPDKARKEVLKDLRTELEKITSKYKLKCDNYILVTNVPLSSVPHSGTHDKIAQEIVPEYLEKIQHIHVWGYDDICRFLDVYTDIRQTYLHLVTPGDLIAELMDCKKDKKSLLAEAVLLYVRTSFEREQYAQLDQAGEIGEKPMPLRRVFIDLDVKLRSEKDIRLISETRNDILNYLPIRPGKETFSASETLLSSDIPRTVLIGGPGQGKSTLCQFVAQIHRAYILQKINELDGDTKKFTPKKVRLPFRVILKDYVQWIVDTEGPHMLEKFLAGLVEERAGRQITSEQIHEILKENPTFLILDGLDEITDRKLRTQMLELLSEFIGRCEDVLKADMQIIATSRPTGYSDQFDPSHFLHLMLISMDSGKVLEYTERWIQAKGFESAKGISLRSSIKDCLADPHFSPLMNTPLQVTIFILIILGGGTPPKQREELFNEYLEVIYKRERAKSKTIIQTEKRLLFGLHQYLGYLLHRRAAESSDVRSRMKEEEFAEEVLHYLRHDDPYTNINELRQKADQMITEAHERLVLLVELENGFFGFELRSIQEFFAAAYLADTASDDSQRFERFQAIALPPHWRNVALFFAGRIGRVFTGEAAHILEGCREIDRHKPDYFTKRGAWLALEIAVDRSFGPKRILQRSSIEYALTLLDGDLSHEKRSEFISRLRQLPKEDLKDHVILLLLQRFEKIHLPDGFNTIEIFHSLDENTSPIEQIMTSAFELRNVLPEKLLEKALEYQLPSQYIKSKFTEICASMSDDKIIEKFLPIFITNPEYLIEIWRGLELPDSIAISMFNTAIETSFIDRPNKKILLQLPPDIIGQVKLAWELFMFLRYIDMEGGRGRIPGGRYMDVLSELIHQELTTPDSQSKTIKNLERIASEPSTIIELRTTVLALLFKVFISPPKPRQLERISKPFLSIIDRNKMETIDSILFNLRIPSLEMIRFITETGYLEDLRGNPLRDSMQRTLEEPETNLFPKYVLNAFESKQIKEIIGFKSRDVLLDMLKARLHGITFRNKEPRLDIEFVAIALNVIADNLITKDPAEWRAWITLDRLTTWKWYGKQKHSDRSNELEKALAHLCEIIELRSDSISGRWELVGILQRAAETDQLEETIKKLLNILGKMPDRFSFHYIFGGRFIGMPDQKYMERLLEIAMASNDRCLRGFLKSFPLFVENMHMLSNRPDIEITSFSFDSSRIISILDSSEGLVREGAILLLAHNNSISFEDTKRLLELSKKDSRPIDHSWGELIRGTVRDSDTQEAIDFLEGILSAGDKYPKAVKYAALEKYQRIARSSTIDIKEQEQDLGLPFQNNM